MSVQTNNNFYGGIGRMFARRSLPALYGAQRTNPQEGEGGASETVDRVSLSPQAPRPLPAGYLEDALGAGRELTAGRLDAESAERLRADRVFGAMAVLAALGDDGNSDSLRLSWPGGLPTPTRDELEAARRRLSQRLHNLDEAKDPEAAQRGRFELLERIGKRDLQGVAAGMAAAQ